MFIRNVSAVLYQSEEKHVEESVDYVSSLYDGYTSVAQQNIITLSKTENITNVLSSQSPQNRLSATLEMTEFKNSLNVLEAVGLYDAKGKLIAENQRVKLALRDSIADEEFFNRAQTDKNAFISSAVISQITEQKTQAVVVPILDDSNMLSGLLVGYLDSQTFKEFLLNSRSDDKEHHKISIYGPRGDSIIDITNSNETVKQTQKYDEQISNLLDKDNGTLIVFDNEDHTTAIKKGNSYIVSMSQSKTIVKEFVQEKLVPVLVVIAIFAHLAIVITEILRNSARYSRIDKLIYALEGINKGGSQNLLTEKELNSKDVIGELAREIDKLQNKTKS